MKWRAYTSVLSLRITMRLPCFTAYFSSRGCALMKRLGCLWVMSLREGLSRSLFKGRKKIDEKSARVIPLIDQSLWIHLARYYNEALASYKRRLWGEDLKDYLLFNNITSTSSTELSRISSRLSIPYRSWHCLRHSRATYLIGHT